MNIKLYTETELGALRSMPKRIANPGARWLEKPKVRPAHRQRSFQASGGDDAEARFLVYQRERSGGRARFLVRNRIPASGRSAADAGALQWAEPRARRHRLSPTYPSCFGERHSGGEESRIRCRGNRPVRILGGCSCLLGGRFQCQWDQGSARPTETALMALDTDALRTLLCDRLCEEVRVEQRPDGALMLRTHFEFPRWRPPPDPCLGVGIGRAPVVRPRAHADAYQLRA